jgi:hypothetical protein
MKGLSMLKQGKLAFPETMKELRNDRDMLGVSHRRDNMDKTSQQGSHEERKRALLRDGEFYRAGVAHARAQIKHGARPEVMFHTALDHATWACARAPMHC